MLETVYVCIVGTKLCHWVIRYHSSSEQWLFDKRGLNADDVANIMGKGNVLNPIFIPAWHVHNGRTFEKDPRVCMQILEM